MSSPLNTPTNTIKVPLKAKNKLLMAVLATILGASVTLTGCDKGNNTETDKPQVEVLADKVIVDKSLVLTSNPERYQPSYNLEGALIPVDLTEIKSPYSADNITLHVSEGDRVEKNQVLATIDTTISENIAAYIDHSFIDVLIDGVPHTIQQAEPLVSSDKPTAKHKKQNSRVDTNHSTKENNADSQPNHPNTALDKAVDTTPATEYKTESTAVKNNIDSTKKIEVTLVFKSPITGEVMKVDDGIKAALLAQHPVKVDSKKDSDNQNNDSDKSNLDATAVNNIDSKSNSQTTDKQINDDNKLKTAAPSKLNYEITQGQTLLTIGDTSQLQLIGKLPLSTKSQLSVGRPVNFTVFDVHTEFTGQISHITPAADGKNLIVRAPLIAGEENPAALEPGMRAAMSIDYGQIELGVRLPKSGIFEADLTKLSAKQTRPTNPVKGYVWVIEQDQHLSYTPIEVVQYFPDSDKYLVHGISNDSLVCLADLPKDADGKAISVN